MSRKLLDVSPAIRWRPLLNGDLVSRASSLVDQIAAVLAKIDPKSSSGTLEWQRYDPSMYSGLAGIALFFSYLDEARPGEGFGDTALYLLEGAIDELNASFSAPSLYAGFPGVGWVSEHLDGWIFEHEEGDSGAEIAAGLRQYLSCSPWKRDYDLINGLVGIGVYALERLPRAGAEECLSLVVSRLDEIDEEGPQGLTWLTPPHLMTTDLQREFPSGNYNLGLAHGVPGVIAFLGKTCAAGFASEQVNLLLEGSVSWLLAQKMQNTDKSVFSDVVAPNIKPWPSRLAWCYGDLGISVALLSAARAIGKKEWEQEALSLARGAAHRSPRDKTVIDAGLCHGAAGVAHLFNRLFQATNEALFADAARLWFERVMTMQQPGKGLAGFLAWLSDQTGQLAWREDPGFLTGIAGIGLALLAATTSIEPNWDRLLLASIAPFTEA